MLKEKLKSESGATLLLALLFFLICAVAGSVVLAAGSTAAGRIAGLQEQEQAYYTVSSAAKMICGEINNKQLTMEETDSNGTVTITDEPKTDMFKSILGTLAKNNYLNINHSQEKGMEAQMEVSPSNEADKSTFRTVYCDVSMDNSYGLFIRLYLKDAEDNTKVDDTYICTVKADAITENTSFARADEADSAKSHNVDQVKITWNNVRIEKGN